MKIEPTLIFSQKALNFNGYASLKWRVSLLKLHNKKSVQKII